MAFTPNKKNQLLGTAIALMFGVGFLQSQIDPLRNQPALEPASAKIAAFGGAGGTAALPFTYTLGALTGFRQVIAGLLWVRTDSFFHSGNYDAVLPMIRMITWLDPNWTDVYATGAWHLMYNFTDTDQRSDRRYLGPGMALLNEGIANNAGNYEMYKEKGWNAFDKIKDYELASEALKSGISNDKEYDVTQVGHLYAHSLERAGRIDESIAQWGAVIAEHKKRIADPKATPDSKGRNESSLRSATTNWEHLQIRKQVRAANTQPPINIEFTSKITRVEPKILKIEGTWRCWGTAGKSYDMGTLESPGKGVLLSGPTDGARVDVRLQDEGYKPQTPQAFSFDIDQSVTLMQEQISTRDGRLAETGGLFVAAGKFATSSDGNLQSVNVYSFPDADVKTYGLGTLALSRGLTKLSPMGKRQAVVAAYPPPRTMKMSFYSDAETATKFAQLSKDTAKLAELDKKNFRVSPVTVEKPGSYSRKIDMSKDPKMYSFGKDKYELILSLNPRIFPDNIQDRFGYSGEGIAESSKYFVVDKSKNNLRMIRRVITLSAEDITGKGEKVLVEK
ncbi:MAG: hypothetical protein H7Y38_03395 [Armatimonadetes bacterium]|nr:hypothetical protein [Armatimonadota bacterium]